MTMPLAEGFLLGIANTGVCAGTCLPALLPFMLSEHKKPAGTIISFLAGRLAAYLLFGLFSGIAGMYLNGRLNPRIFAVLSLIFACWLLFYAVGKLRFSLHRCNAISTTTGRHLPFVAGLIMGLNPCPPFLIGFSRALSLHNLLLPVAFFIGFYVGSSLWTILLLFTGKPAAHPATQRIGQLAAILVALWYALQSISLLF